MDGEGEEDRYLENLLESAKRVVLGLNAVDDVPLLLLYTDQSHLSRLMTCDA